MSGFPHLAEHPLNLGTLCDTFAKHQINNHSILTGVWFERTVSTLQWFDT